MLLRRFGLIGGLLIILGGLLLWQFLDRPTPIAEAPVDNGLTMTAYARDVTLMATDAEGSEAWRVSAPAARYFDRSDLWQFEAPRWAIQTARGEPWQGTANAARSWDGERKARLEGDVILQRDDVNGPTRLTTEWIDMRLPARYAETSEPVKLTAPSYTIDAIGVRAWLAEERMELINNARGRYETNP